MEPRIARLEADVSHIQRDLSGVQADVKQIAKDVASIQTQLAILIANQASFQTPYATQKWVGERLFQAGTIVVAIMIALAGALASLVVFAPQIWTWLGAPGFPR